MRRLNWSTMKLYKRSVLSALCTVFLFSTLSTVQAAQSGGLYLQVKGYNWTEYIDGDQVLEESGPLFGIGLRLDPDPLKLSVQGKVEAYFGQVEYDGQTMDGVPLDDETAYVGVLGDLDGVFPAWINAAKSSAILLFGGAGVHVWDRELGQENEDLGYTEGWYMFYGRLGGGFYAIESGVVKGYATAGVKVPFFTQNSITVEDATDEQDVDLEPEGQPGPFIEAGWRWKKYFVNAFYEYTKLDMSDVETILVQFPGTTEAIPWEIYQPESEVHILGVNAGMYF